MGLAAHRSKAVGRAGSSRQPSIACCIASMRAAPALVASLVRVRARVRVRVGVRIRVRVRVRIRVRVSLALTLTLKL